MTDFTRYRYKVSSPNNLETVHTNSIVSARGHLWRYHNKVSGSGIIDKGYFITDKHTGTITTEAGF